MHWDTGRKKRHTQIVYPTWSIFQIDFTHIIIITWKLFPAENEVFLVEVDVSEETAELLAIVSGILKGHVPRQVETASIIGEIQSTDALLE